jgi:acyl-CoA reductase-like NAD-dependent aldehyde dehydrogenase
MTVTQDSPIRSYDRIFIGGEWVEPASAETFSVENPATKETIASIPWVGADDVDRAVAAAKAAQPGWAATPLAERQAVLRRAYALLEARADEMTALLATEMGCPVGFGRVYQTGLAMITLGTVPELVERVEWRSRTENTDVIRVPRGVVGVITPWNYPLHQLVGKTAYAIIVGNTVVAKPSEIAPLNSYLFAEILADAGLPPGVFNLVTGPGPTAGERLVTNPDVSMVTFTGSTGVGRRLSELAAPQVKPLALELGGKSANIWLDDVDVATAAPDAIFNAFVNTGQTCMALTRLLVPRSRLAEAEQALVETLPSFPVGDPLDPTAFLGPLASAAQHKKVSGYIDTGIDEGARLIAGGPGTPEAGESGHTGGHLPVLTHFDRGYYVRPTIFSDVTPQMRIAREEIFGPVLPVIPYDTVDEAVDIANSVEYGLYGGVQSASKERAVEVASRLHTGGVQINGGAFNPLAPFGGVKQSGHGREYGVWGFDELTTLKTLTF